MRKPNRNTCPVCNGETEFVQFSSGESDMTKTKPSVVGDGLLELQTCLGCGRGIETVLTAEKQTVVTTPNK